MRAELTPRHLILIGDKHFRSCATKRDMYLHPDPWTNNFTLLHNYTSLYYCYFYAKLGPTKIFLRPLKTTIKCYYQSFKNFL